MPLPAALLSSLKAPVKLQNRSDFGTKPVPREAEPTSQACFTQPQHHTGARGREHPPTCSVGIERPEEKLDMKTQEESGTSC